jgi:hypothetical protein
MEKRELGHKADMELKGGSNPQTAPQEAGQRSHLVFFGLSLAFIVAFLLIPLLLIDTNFYIRHSNYVYDPVVDYKASLTDNASDIVVYGDSSALHNVVPTIIKAQTNLDVFNLGFTADVFAGAPDLMLDRYLAHNKFPRTIVLYITPTTAVNGFDLDSVHFYQAAMVLERYASLLDAVRFYAKNPRRMFGVAAVVVRNLVTPPEPTEKIYRSVMTTLSTQGGWLPTPDIFHGAGILAEKRAEQNRPPLVADSKYILEFKKKYEARGARVLVYVSPVRACSDLSTAEVKAAYGTLADNEPYSFPCESYLGGFHLNEQAAKENSLQVASFLLSELSVTSAKP